MIDPTLTGPRIVQYVTCNSAQSVANTCAFVANVTSGNLLVVVGSNVVDTNCVGAINSLYSDTRSTAFTYASEADNLSGGNVCIGFGVLGSSGTDTITAVSNGSTSQSMVVYEIAGIASPSLDVTNSATGGGTGSLATGSATATTANSILLCGFGGSSNGAQFYTASFSPSTSAMLNTISPLVSTTVRGGTSAIQFTGSGSKSCTFTFGPGGGNNPAQTAAALAVIKYSPVSAASKRRMAQVY
jgi:hypothetical protein